MSEDDLEAPRPIDPLAMAADLLALGSRRPDLAETQRSELYYAALHRFRDFPGSEVGMAHQWELFAWIDLVSPPAGRVLTQGEILQEGTIRGLIGQDPDRLLLGREPAVTAAPLAALAQRRPDLSVLQRHEVLVAARKRLAQPGYGRKIEATAAAIFAWIDVVVPASTRVTDGRTPDEVKRPAPSVDDLEDGVDELRQRLRARDQLKALEADVALESLVSHSPERPPTVPMPGEREQANEGSTRVPTPSDSAFTLLAANDPRLTFKPPERMVDRYRLPGWSDLDEFWYEAKHRMRPSRPPGRPSGPYLIQSREEIETVYRELWTKLGRRPLWNEVARGLNVDERTLLRARMGFGLDKATIRRKPE